MLLQTKFNLFSSSTEKASDNFIYSVPMNGNRALNYKTNITADMKHIEKSAPKIFAFLNVMSPRFQIPTNCNELELKRVY